ncbi:MAG: hypothetical protein CTY29_00265 [Methylobacter sp.]|nr:MAG: hypothetical protein CTY29_00265 [Methylobacter sp.]
MKKIVFIAALFPVFTASANDPKNEWHNTVLSDDTMKKIQAVKYDYKKCVVDEMKKTTYQNLDSRKATEDIIKQCESELAKMREIYLQEKVPDVIADRHLKQMRIQTTRSLLQEIMFAEAARKSGGQ